MKILGRIVAADSTAKTITIEAMKPISGVIIGRIALLRTPTEPYEASPQLILFDEEEDQLP